MSAYLILEQTEEDKKNESGKSLGAHWQERGTIDALSGEHAVRLYVQARPNSKGGVFLAIPERSAKTIRVKVETVQKVSVDAGEDKSA